MSSIPLIEKPVNKATEALRNYYQLSLQAQRGILEQTQREIVFLQETIDHDFERLNSDDIREITLRIQDAQEYIPKYQRLIARYELRLAELE